MPIVRLQQHTVMPLHMHTQLHMPPWSIVHRFCTMLQAILSSQEQYILKPPVHFSTLKVQRGTIMAEGKAVGAPTAAVPIPGTPRPGIPIPVRSIIIVPDMVRTPFSGRPHSCGISWVPARKCSRKPVRRALPRDEGRL